MTSKKKPYIFIISIVLIAIITAIYLSTFHFSTKQTVFPSDSGKFNFNMDISQTSVTKIAEDDRTITYRLTWLTNNPIESTCNTKKDTNIKFTISDYQALEDKPILPNNVQNQFDVKGEGISFIGLKAYQYPCEDNQQEVPIEDLIVEEDIICDLVSIEGKPIISCYVNIILNSEVPVNYYGIIDGYTDLTFIKGESK